MKFSQRDLMNRTRGFGNGIPLGKDDINEIFVKSQGRQYQMTPEKQAKIREMMRLNPDGGVTLTIDITGKVLDIKAAQ